jgi:hypothetical protein
MAEGGEAAEKEDVRHQIGTDRVVGLGGGSRAEAVLVAAKEGRPACRPSTSSTTGRVCANRPLTNCHAD